MKKTLKKQLLQCAELIVNKEKSSICHAMADVSSYSVLNNWMDSDEAKMIDPGDTYWWGFTSMGHKYSSDEARGARLIGIAMMITMPKDIIDHKCCKPSKKKKSK